MTRDIAITYTHATRLLSVTGQSNAEVIGGTYGDANSTKLTFTITGVTGQYTVKCALASPVKDGHDVAFPEYALTNNSLVIPGEVMSSAMHGEIPVQLHFTTSDEEWYSLNVVKLKILPAIIGEDMEIIPPAPGPTTSIVSDIEYDDDVTLTIYYRDGTSKDIELNTSMVPTNVARVVREAYIQTDSVNTQYVYTYNLGYMPSSVTVYERSDARDQSVSSRRTIYDDTMAHSRVELDVAAEKNKVTITFASAPGDAVFWIKVIA